MVVVLTDPVYKPNDKQQEKNTTTMIYDYIIVGAGIAGLNAARLLPKNKRVLILCKMSTWNSNNFLGSRWNCKCC